MEQTASAGRGMELGNRVEVIEVEESVDSPPRGVSYTYGRRGEVGFIPQWLISAPPPAELFSPPEEDGGRGHDHKRARVPASSKAILSLKEVSGGDAEGRLQAECAVCLNDFCADDSLRAMPCSHVFHEHCIFRWLRVNHVCPLCRHALPTELDDDDLHGYGYPSIPTRPVSLPAVREEA